VIWAGVAFALVIYDTLGLVGWWFISYKMHVIGIRSLRRTSRNYCIEKAGSRSMAMVMDVDKTYADATGRSNTLAYTDELSRSTTCKSPNLDNASCPSREPKIPKYHNNSKHSNSTFTIMMTATGIHQRPDSVKRSTSRNDVHDTAPLSIIVTNPRDIKPLITLTSLRPLRRPSTVFVQFFDTAHEYGGCIQESVASSTRILAVERVHAMAAYRNINAAIPALFFVAISACSQSAAVAHGVKRGHFVHWKSGSQLTSIDGDANNATTTRAKIICGPGRCNIAWKELLLSRAVDGRVFLPTPHTHIHVYTHPSTPFVDKTISPERVLVC
jgi:hypothetical protein